MIAQATKTQKSVLTILATYTFRGRNRVCFSIQSLDSGEKYNTCFDNGHESCLCEGNSRWHKRCKHIKELAPRAARIIEEQETRSANVRMFYSEW